MTKRAFSKGDVVDLLCGEDVEGFEKVADIEQGDSRWFRRMLSLFRFEGVVYGIPWRKGLTENQEDEYPTDGQSGPSIEFSAYEPVEVMVVEWRKKP